MGLFLGLDGGGTGCRAAICDAEGRIIGRAEGGAANVFTDPDGARARIGAVTAAALASAGLAGPERITAVLGLAGANVGDGVGHGGAAAARGLRFARVRVVSDAVIALHGALDGPLDGATKNDGAAGANAGGDGVVATVGTGSVFASRRNGRLRQVGGWGFVLGDEGSGAAMGRALLSRALTAHDGLCAATPLLAAVLAEAGGPGALVASAAGASPAGFARHAQRIVDAAGDPAAEAILGAAEAGIAAAIDHLRAGAALPVCLLGGLGPFFASRLRRRYGDLIVPPRGTALDGALRMARDLGAR